MALIAALLIAAGCGSGGDEPEREPLRLPPEGRWFGFSSNTFQHTGRDRGALDQGITIARTVADARGAGANSIRTQIAWSELEPEPGRLNRPFARLIERFIARVERSGGRVVAVLGVPPPWASQQPGEPRAAPRRGAVRAYARYAARVAELFPSLLAIETWNEPNATFFWLPGRPDARLYGRMHVAAARAIRAVDRDTEVLVGGLIAVPNDGPEIEAASGYVRRMGIDRDDYDGFAVHIYPDEAFEATFEDARSAVPDGVPLWITETGVTTTGPSARTARAQAAELADVLARFYAEERVQGVWVHTLYDDAGSPPDSMNRGYGVMGLGGERKPAYCALARAAGRRACR